MGLRTIRRTMLSLSMKLNTHLDAVDTEPLVYFNTYMFIVIQLCTCDYSSDVVSNM